MQAKMKWTTKGEMQWSKEGVKIKTQKPVVPRKGK